MTIQMTKEQFDALIAAVKPLEPEIRNSGNFAKCSSRFSGLKQDDVGAFIDAITVYKACMGISVDNSLKGIPMLLNQTSSVDVR